jgi:hypothetical protein
MAVDLGEPTTVTDDNGDYQFTSLAAGEYVTREVVPDGMTQTFPSGGAYSFKLASGQSITGRDFGNQPSGGCQSNADCDDGDSCSNDVCESGICTNTEVVCEDGLECTVGICDPAAGACSFSLVDDGTSCGQNGAVCMAGVCQSEMAVINLQGIMEGNLFCDSGLDGTHKEMFIDNANLIVNFSAFPLVTIQIQFLSFDDPFNLKGLALLSKPGSGVIQLFGNNGGLGKLALSGKFKLDKNTQELLSIKGEFQIQDSGEPMCNLTGKFEAK